MKKAVLALLLIMLPMSLSAQRYQVYNRDGQVTVQRQGQDPRPVVLDEMLTGKDLLCVGHHSSITLLEMKGKYLSVFGTCQPTAIDVLVKSNKTSFLERMKSVFRGREERESAYVTYKDSGPDKALKEAFLAALKNPQAEGSYRVSLQALRNGKPQEGNQFLEGDEICFRVENREPFPLCVGILCIDSAGNWIDCLEDREQLVLVPAESTLDLTEDSGYVIPPFGTDRYYLFASRNLFWLTGLDEIQEPAQVAADAQIGFCSLTLYTSGR